MSLASSVTVATQRRPGRNAVGCRTLTNTRERNVPGREPGTADHERIVTVTRTREAKPRPGESHAAEHAGGKRGAAGNRDAGGERRAGQAADGTDREQHPKRRRGQAEFVGHEHDEQREPGCVMPPARRWPG